MHFNDKAPWIQVQASTGDSATANNIYKSRASEEENLKKETIFAHDVEYTGLSD